MRAPTEAERVLVGLLAEEMAALNQLGRISYETDALSAFSLIGCLQLAWRHPGLSVAHKRLIETHVKGLSKAFAGYPAVLETISLGWDAAVIAGNFQ